ncbi:cell surface protein [Haloarcula sp. S1CR25-12]|uniref:Cell surface protein n=1 Tax=Haloarcula saliterrae TaxID=2950534 RepID=A0ABU2FHU9_9EURY|nr:cell surface protein [Haloarcula sp. S1CR25-12]MDS0261361.1 cell surface protein [Haloarcula sp. S1CR25-12]
MTHQTRSVSTIGPVLAAALATLAVLATATGVGVAAAQSDSPTVRVTDGATTADGNATVGVVLTSAPDGLAGYYLDVVLDAPGDARLVDASYPERFGLHSAPEFDDDGGRVTLEAADLNGAVEPGATDVRLATVTVAGGDPGEGALSVEPRQFDADDGSEFRPASASAVSQSGGTETSAERANSETQTTETETATGGSGPLGPGLAVVAVGLLTVAGLRRRRGA